VCQPHSLGEVVAYLYQLSIWRSYAGITPEAFEAGLKRAGLPEHVATMGELHRADRYDRQADEVERGAGKPPMNVRDFVSLHADAFGGHRP
jgi:hypothetical protein